MVRGFGGEDDAAPRGGIALETSSRGLPETVAADPVVGSRARPTAGVLAAIALLAATPAPAAMPIGMPTHNPGLVTLAAVAVHGGVVRGLRGGVAAGRTAVTTRSIRPLRPGVRAPVHHRPIPPRPPVVRPLPLPGPWVRPPSYWWHPGMAVAAGAAIGFVSAAAAASWAGSPPSPGYCWYYTDADRTKGFWDVCPK
ncbi:hypothetical protein ACXIUS_05100 [Bosea thiooxidans]|nr:hypothetical protein [Bosea sp. (in: a-proteobacteria)]